MYVLLFPDEVQIFPGSQFGNATGPVFLNQLGCSGLESFLLQCNQVAREHVDLRACDHSKDAGVRCIGEESESCFPVKLMSTD